MSTTVHLSGPRGERGIALVAALLVVMLVAIVGATFMLVATNERSMSSNVQVSRASLLAADAGVRVTQQMLANQAKHQLDSLTAIWVSGPVITSPATMFAAGTQTFTSTSPQFNTTATITFTDQSLAATAQTYNYRYTITSNGTFGAQGNRQVQSTGILRVSAQRGTFADYMMFMDAAQTSSGTPVWFNSSMHFDGRVHTNGEFHFAYQPLFQDMVTSVNGKAWYWNNGAAQEVAASSYGTTDLPQFFGGFIRGAASVALPANANDQQAGALGLTLPTGTAPSAAQISTALGVAGAPSNKVYVLHDGLNQTTGGIYVQGDVQSLAMVADTIMHTQQYTFVQGGATTRITVDAGANTTTVVDASGTTIYAGVPNSQLFVNGGIADLHGPARASGIAPPAVAAGQQMLVTATADIVIQGDVTCENFPAATNVLGIFSSGGSVRIGSSAPNDMNLDAYVMAAGATGAFTVDGYNSGSARGSFHLRGGIAERFYGPFSILDASGNPISGYLADFHYDRRGLVPPSYPKTNRFDADQPTARTLAWKEI